MELREIADILDAAKRLGRPEFPQSIQISATLADDIVKTLRAVDRKRKLVKATTIGARPK